MRAELSVGFRQKKRSRSTKEFPIALTNLQRETLFAWEEGSSLRWERMAPNNEILENKVLTSSSKPWPLLDREGKCGTLFPAWL